MENTTSTGKPHTVADQVVGMMASSGIKHLYAITGDSLNALTEAISNDGRIKFIHMRHEESGAFAASAEAQLTGHLAACAGSSGPGHVHLINGLYDAQRSNAPVLAIASTCGEGIHETRAKFSVKVKQPLPAKASNGLPREESKIYAKGKQLLPEKSSNGLPRRARIALHGTGAINRAHLNKKTRHKRLR